MARHLGALEVDAEWADRTPPPQGMQRVSKKRKRKIVQAESLAEDLALTRVNGWTDVDPADVPWLMQFGAPIALSREGTTTYTWNEAWDALAKWLRQGNDPDDDFAGLAAVMREVKERTNDYYPPRVPDPFYAVQQQPHAPRRRWPHDYPDAMARKASRGGRPNEDLDGLGARDPDRVTNADIEQWIDNDEGLYSWWKSTRLSKREFIRQNKPQIVHAIRNMLTGAKRVHYLVYDKPKGPLNGRR